MTWLLYGIAGALILAGVGVYSRANPFSSRLLEIILICGLPILVANTAVMKSFQLAPSFVKAYVVFTGFYVAIGVLAGLLLFCDKLTFLNIVGLALLCIGLILVKI